MSEHDSTVVVELSIDDIKEAMRTDCIAFLSFYLGDELTLEVPEFHEEIWDEFVGMVKSLKLGTVTSHLHKLFCVPRGHAKSTLTKLAVILFMRYSPLAFTLYASVTSVIAKAAIRDIMLWLRSDQDQEVYGEAKVIRSNESEQLWQIEIGTPDYGRKLVTFKALGSEQKVRGTLVDGKRPQLIVMDDTEDLETSATAESQAKLDAWCMGALLKASARISVRIMLGNMVRGTTLLARLSKDPVWNPTVFGALIRNKKTGLLEPLWPGFYTVKQLLDEYKSFRKVGQGHVWLYEMMNMTADSVFGKDLLKAIRVPRPLPDEITSGFIMLDPAYGLNSWNDQSSITVHVKKKGFGIPILAEVRHGRWTEAKILEELVSLSQYWNLITWGIEGAAGQALFVPIFKSLLRDWGMNPDIFNMILLPSGGVAKSSRIQAFQQSVEEQSYAIAEEEEDLFIKLKEYDPTSKKHDDDCDSAAYGVIAWAQQGNIIDDAGKYHEMMGLLEASSGESYHESEYVPY